MPKRIAYIGIKGLPSQAGVDRVVEAIVTYVDKANYIPVVYCSKRVVSPEVQAQYPGVDLKLMPTLPGKHLHATSLFLIAAIHALFWGTYDLIHLHNVEASYVLPLLRLRYKVVSTSHGSAHARDKWSDTAKKIMQLMERPFIRMSNVVTSVSKPLGAQYEAEYGKKVHYIPNGIPQDTTIDLESADEILRQHGVEPGKFVLFAAGRIIATKGCHLLLEAYQELAPDIDLVIVGDASHVPLYEKKLHDMANSRVHFIPFIARKEVLFGLVSRAHLFVFPSLVEAMSIMLLEVTALGIPVICSDIPENEAVLPASTRLFRSNDAQDLRLQLEFALAEPEKMADIAAQAQRWADEQYQWEKIVEDYTEIYEGVIRRRRLQQPKRITKETAV